MSAEHYTLLEWLIERKKTDILIRYTTNFSTLKFGSKDVLQYWRRFSDVKVYASLDASHEQGKYLRKNLKWDQVLENRRRLADECPHVLFFLMPTVSIYNAFHFLSFYREWFELGYALPHRTVVNALTEPSHMSIRVFDRDNKKRLEALYREFIAWLKGEDYRQSEILINGLEALIHYMWQSDDSDQLPEFARFTKKLDQIRQEDFRQVNPGISNLI